MPRVRATAAELMERPEIREKFDGNLKLLQNKLGRHTSHVHWFDYRVRFGKEHVCRSFRTCFGEDVVFGSCTAVGPYATIAKNTEIKMGAVIGGYVKIGSDVTIGPYSFISHDVTIGNGSVIGTRVFIDSRVGIGRHIKIGDGASIGLLDNSVDRDIGEMERYPPCRHLLRKI